MQAAHNVLSVRPLLTSLMVFLVPFVIAVTSVQRKSSENSNDFS
jgi:hypothetical protein